MTARNGRFYALRLPLCIGPPPPPHQLLQFQIHPSAPPTPSLRLYRPLPALQPQLHLRYHPQELAADGRDATQIAVVANAHEPEPPTTTRFERRAGIVFVGNFNHLPNRDAVLFFARHVMPRLLRLPRVRDDPSFVFHVVGANAMPESIRLLNSSRILVHGYVPTLRGLYAQMRVSVAPLRWGAGVKGKVNTAHALGVAVVATSIALDGMHATDGTHALIADDADGLADAVVRAYYNATTWRRLTKHGRRLLDLRFSASRAAIGLLQVLAHLSDANTLMGMKSLALSSAPPRDRKSVV